MKKLIVWDTCIDLIPSEKQSCTANLNLEDRGEKMGKGKRREGNISSAVDTNSNLYEHSWQERLHCKRKNFKRQEMKDNSLKTWNQKLAEHNFHPIPVVKAITEFQYLRGNIEQRY